MLAGVARGEKGSKGEGGQARLSNIDTGRLSGLKYKLICRFKLATDMVRGGIQKFVNDTDKPAFLKREVMGLGVDGYQ